MPGRKPRHSSVGDGEESGGESVRASRGDDDREALAEEFGGYRDDVGSGVARCERAFAAFAIRRDGAGFRVVNRVRERANLGGDEKVPEWAVRVEWVLRWWCDRQRQFLEKEDFLYLAPMEQREVAGAYAGHAGITVGRAETDVSRDCIDTLVEFPWSPVPVPMFELFSPRTGQGDGISLAAALRWVELAVEQEDKAAPLSDAEIAAWINGRLGREVVVAERVANLLRPKLGIPGRPKRRAEKPGLA